MLHPFDRLAEIRIEPVQHVLSGGKPVDIMFQPGGNRDRLTVLQRRAAGRRNEQFVQRRRIEHARGGAPICHHCDADTPQLEPRQKSARAVDRIDNEEVACDSRAASSSVSSESQP